MPGGAQRRVVAASTTLPLADVARAHQLLEDRAVPGRLLLIR